ncbi:MAG: hypothetical protein AVO34_10845 [Firmicutes bacterium ML8_F2]|jgi:uncharacterized membrane protein|nr:MAG: hypothetical protein AVO34_10845 [Firmicutes bacterium ML8_F2]
MKLKTIFTTGFLTILPLAVTIYVFYLIFSFLDNLLGNLIQAIIGFRVPGIGFAAGIALILIIGFIASNIIGRRLIDFSDRLLQRVPLAKSIYVSARQIIDAFTIQGKAAFQKVVLLEYPRRGLYVLGFVTGSSKGEIQGKTHEETLNIFIPTTPNPTSGMLILAPRSEVIDLDMTVEEGMKVIISGGLFSPPVDISKNNPT